MGHDDDGPKLSPGHEPTTSFEPSPALPGNRIQQVLPLAPDAIPPPKLPRRPLYWWLTRTRIDSAERLAIHLERARELGRPATLTGQEWLEALIHFNKRCAYCDSVAANVIEHVVPLKRDWGGGTTAGNCVPSCAGCNGSKTDRGPAWVLEQWGPAVYDRVQSFLDPRMTEEDRHAAERFASEPERRARELVELAKSLSDNQCLARLLGWSLSMLRLYARKRSVPDALAEIVRELRPRLDAHFGTAEEFTAAIETEREQRLLEAEREQRFLEAERAASPITIGPTRYVFVPASSTEDSAIGEDQEDSAMGDDQDDSPWPATPPSDPPSQDEPDDVDGEEAPRAAKQLRLFEDPKPNFPWQRR